MRIMYSWYYMATGKKRHVVRESELRAFPQQVAICGAGVLAFLPPRARWLNDEEGLESREECASCRRTLDVEIKRMDENEERKSKSKI